MLWRHVVGAGPPEDNDDLAVNYLSAFDEHSSESELPSAFNTIEEPPKGDAFMFSGALES